MPSRSFCRKLCAMLAIFTVVLTGSAYLRRSGAVLALLPFSGLPDEGIGSSVGLAWQVLVSPPRTPTDRLNAFWQVDPARVTSGQVRRIVSDLRRDLERGALTGDDVQSAIDNVAQYAWSPDARAFLYSLATQPRHSSELRRLAVRRLAGSSRENAHPTDSEEVAILRQYLTSDTVEDQLAALEGFRRPTIQALQTELLDYLHRNRTPAVQEIFLTTLNREPAPPLVFFPLALDAARSPVPAVQQQAGSLLFRYAVAEYSGELHGETYRKQYPEYYRGGGLTPRQVLQLRDAFQLLSTYPEFQYDAESGVALLDLIP